MDHRLGACPWRCTGPCQSCGTTSCPHGSRASILQVVHGLPTSTPDGSGPMPHAVVIPLRVSRAPLLSHRSGLAGDGKDRLAHVKDMDTDGVDVSIVYPTVGLLLYSVQDSALLTAIFRTYNDWLAEFCNACPDRLKGIAMLNVDDVPSAVKELERCAKMGLIGGLITVYPPEGRGYNLPAYEPLWAAAEDLEIPLGLHIATNRPGVGQEFGVGEQADRVSSAFLANADHWIRMSLGHMVFSGVFERHPTLQIGSVEMELSWIPHFLDRIDYTYTQRTQQDRYRFKEAMLPSDYMHPNGFYGCHEDGSAIKLRVLIGVYNLLWGSDYPHVESTFPRTQQILGEILAEGTEEEQAKIAGGNAARIYHLE